MEGIKPLSGEQYWELIIKDKETARSSILKHEAMRLRNNPTHSDYMEYMEDYADYIVKFEKNHSN